MNALAWLKAWFKSKGGVAHVTALAWAFLVAAYAMNTQFHDFVKHAYTLLPAWAEDAVTLSASLWAFYKTWKPTQAAPPAPAATPEGTK